MFVGYHQATGDGHRGGGTTHLYDTLYSSGFNNYGYMGLSQGRNIGDVRIGGRSKIKGPASLLWGYHEQFLSVRQDQWYAIFTPNIDRPGATSSLLGREIDATLLLRFPSPAHDDRPQLPGVTFRAGISRTPARTRGRSSSRSTSTGSSERRPGARVRRGVWVVGRKSSTPHPCGRARPVLG